MNNLECSYIYPFEKNRYRYYWNKKLKKKGNLTHEIFNNAIILPPKRSTKFYGDGCVLDKRGMIIETSFMYGIEGSVYMGGSYSIKDENINHIEEDIIYLGFLNNHWGHFLVDFTTRLWYAIQNPEKKCAFLLRYDVEKFYLSKSIIRFLELCNLKIENIYFINRVTVVKNIIIPEQAYEPSIYYSDEYLNTFNLVLKNIKPNRNKKIDNLFLTRSCFKKSKESEIGSEIFDNLFSKNKYQIISPESESLDDQIFYINSCENFASISSSAVHNLIFAQSSNIHAYIINKSYHINTLIIDLFKIKNICPQFIDAYTVKYPTKIGSGPFILVYNEFLKKFIKDYNLKDVDEYFKTGDFLKKCITNYEIAYKNIVYMQKILIDVSENRNDWNYYNLYYFNIWIKKYSQFEMDTLEEGGS